MRRRNLIENEQGFTLIEIIAVLVILGILAAVAVPKFIGMQEDAHEAAVDSALAAGSSNAMLSYSKFILENGNTPTSIASNEWTGGTGTTAVEIATDLGDFTAGYAYNNTNGQVTITISAGPDWFAASSATKTKTFTISD